MESNGVRERMRDFHLKGGGITLLCDVLSGEKARWKTLSIVTPVSIQHAHICVEKGNGMYERV